jgi:chromosome segregation ATPase
MESPTQLGNENPNDRPADSMAAREAELQRCLKENESQRTEIDSYINQLNIQLHRWQLRLQTLNERNRDLKAELAALHPTIGLMSR